MRIEPRRGLHTYMPNAPKGLVFSAKNKEKAGKKKQERLIAELFEGCTYIHTSQMYGLYLHTLHTLYGVYYLILYSSIGCGILNTPCMVLSRV